MPTPLVKITGASITRSWLPVRDDRTRMIEVKPTGREAGRDSPSSPYSDLCIAVLESVPVSAPAAARPAAARAAAASVGRAPDSSRRTGQTCVFQSACRRSQPGAPTSAYPRPASGEAPSSASLACTYRGKARNAFHWVLPSPQTRYRQFRHVGPPGSVPSSQALNAIAFEGGFEVYVEVRATSSHGSVRGGTRLSSCCASSLSVITSLV